MKAPHATTTPALDRPVRVEPRVRTVRVAAVVPCFNRPEDLALLAGDLRRCELAGAAREAGIELSVVVVDNASSPALAPPECGPVPVELMRLATNTGGSGGYNAGMAVALSGAPNYLWLVDSDARVEPDTLRHLVDALEADDSLAVVGPVLTDTATGRVHEVGGRLDRRTGRFGPMHEALPEGAEGVLACDYVAACCALVRADAVRRVGLFPEVFLNADDVEWCLRLSEVGRAGVVARARAAHPRFDRFSALPRYFGARNAFGPIEALGLGRRTRARRAGREVLRAVNQRCMGRADLAALHLRGLADAARGRVRGLPPDLPRTEPMRSFDQLGASLGRAESPAGPLLIDWPEDIDSDGREQVCEALRGAGLDPGAAARAPTRSLAAMARRAVAGPRFDVAVVPAKGSPSHWFVARTMIEVAAGGYLVRREHRWRALAACAGIVLRGGWYAARLTLRGPGRSPLPRPEQVRALMPAHQTGTTTPTLSVVVLSYNRKDALLETLERLRSGQATCAAEVIVVDNASTDGSAEAARKWAHTCQKPAPRCEVLAMETNEAIAGFNRGVEAATGDLVLILDDDARPDDDALAAAIDLLAERPDLGAATLVPFHPATGRTEWPFADRLAEPSDAWPVMGCCNLVRRGVWLALGGYDERFFLYRNDTDLAMKVLASGLGVRCDPAWRCEHDSPAAARKSPRWCRLATRNWIWLARRHGRGWRAALGAMAGWAWAHRLAGLSPSRQTATLRGGLAGLLTPPPPLPAALRPDGRAFASLMRLRFGR
jgi:GT2 family glycosyltransferase